MIGSIPSYYTDLEYSLADEHLFPQLTDTTTAMYPTSTQSNPYPGHPSQYITPPEQPRPSYPSAPASSTFPAYNNSNVYSDPGSFSAVGAAFGFNPDQPIQIPSHNLPSSQNAMVSTINSMDYNNQSIPPPPQPPHQQFHHQQQFSVPMHNQPYQTPAPDWLPRQTPKRQRYGDDSEEDDPQLEAAKRRPWVSFHFIHFFAFALLPSNTCS